jgi:peptidyl-prolyl cis-trans isomerase SurA
MKLLRALPFLLLSPAFFSSDVAQAEIVERIVAIIGNDVITLTELNELVDALHGPSLAAIDDLEVRANRKKEVQKMMLDQLIDQRLLTQQYSKLQLAATEQDVDRLVDAICKQNNITLDVLVGELERQGMSLPQYRDQMRQHVLQTKFVEQQIRPKVSISEEDLKNLYTQKTGEVQADETFELEGVLVNLTRSAGPESIEQARKQARQVREKLQSGLSTDEVARGFSDGSVMNIGNMGTFRQGELMEELEQAAMTLQEKQVSEPVESANGIYLVRMVKRGKQSNVKPFAEVREQLYRRLYDQQVEELMQTFIKNTRRETHVELML